MEDLLPIIPEGFDPNKPLIIAGPCSAETEEQVLCTANELAANGIRIFRAGIWKPRTKPGGFEGVGAPGLEWMKESQRDNRNAHSHRSRHTAAYRRSP